MVAVVADLNDSSRLGTNRHGKSTARVCQAGVEGAARSLHEFGANFIDIQGDGGFGLFWGDLAFERAFCAAATSRTFSEDFVKQLENSTKTRSHVLPETGHKVGIAVDRLMVSGARHYRTHQRLTLQRRIPSRSPLVRQLPS